MSAAPSPFSHLHVRAGCWSLVSVATDWLHASRREDGLTGSEKRLRARKLESEPCWIRTNDPLLKTWLRPQSTTVHERPEPCHCRRKLRAHVPPPSVDGAQYPSSWLQFAYSMATAPHTYLVPKLPSFCRSAGRRYSARDNEPLPVRLPGRCGQGMYLLRPPDPALPCSHIGSTT